MFKFFVFIFVASVFVSARDHYPEWATHCWDHAPHRLMDPFCALLSEQCENAPEVDNGAHSQIYNKTVFSTVNYVCNDGFTMKGPETIRCEKNEPTEKAHWSQPPTCIKVTCPAIPDIENGYHEGSNSTLSGTSIQYFCNVGYAIDDKDTIKCVLLDNGQHATWSQPIPKCIKTGCPRPQISNGYVALPNPLYVAPTASPEITTTTSEPTTTTDFTTTTYEPTTSLNDNYTDTDTVNFTTASLPVTNDNGTTDTDTVNVTTPSFPVANDNATISSETVSNTSVTDVDADNDTSTAMPDAYNVTATTEPDISNDTTTTIDTGTTVPDTTTETTTMSTTPQTTTISPYIPITNETTFQINDTIVYMCNPGYGFISSENIGIVKNSLDAQCVSINKSTTTWSTTVVCVPDCLSVPDVENANHTEPPNTLTGSFVTYNCLPGFQMVGPSSALCLPTGNWSELPFCRGCLDPPEVAYGYHELAYSTTINSSVSYVCNDGFSMIGLESVTCKSFDQPPYAQWTNPPSCTLACGPVPSVENGEHTIPDNFLLGSNTTFSCLNGSLMSGSPDVVCQASGNWSELPYCDPVCLTPPDIPKMMPTTYVYNETTKATFTCEQHYILVGNSTLECISGNWSKPYPYCECDFKPIDIVFIIDGSGSLGLHGFQQTLDFVANMVKRFPVATTNFGLLAFSSDVYRQFYLNEYVNNTAGMIERIQNTTYPTGNTYTYMALMYARQQMFQEKNGMRPNVTHTAIIVTDGQSNDFNETVHQAELLKATGVTIYSVGVGLTNHDELQLMASRPEYVFTVDNYASIDQIAGPLAGITCSSLHGALDDDELALQ